ALAAGDLLGFAQGDPPMLEFRDYALRGRNAGWRYVVGGGLTLGLTAARGVAAAIAALATGLLTPKDAQNLAHASSPVAFFVATAVCFALTLASLLGAARWINGKRPQDLFGRWSWADVATGAGIWLTVQTAASGVDLALAPHGFTL